MIYIIGIILLLVVGSILWELMKRAFNCLVGLVILGLLIIVAITWGPPLIVALIGLLIAVLPYLLYIGAAIIAIAILWIVCQKIKNFFVTYPWQATILFGTIVSAAVILLILI